MYKIHTYISLIFCIPLVIACFTGSVLVYKDEINNILASAAVNISPSHSVGQNLRLGFDELRRIISAKFPDYEIVGWNIDKNPQKSDKIWLIKHNDKEWEYIYLDAFSGEIKSGPTPHDSGFMGVLAELHENLLFEERGQIFVGIVGVIAFVIALSGFIVYRNFWKSLFKLRFAKLAVFMSDIHKFIGVFSTPIMLIIALSGAWWELGFLFSKPFDTSDFTINAEIYYKKAVEHEDFEAYNNLGVLCENKNRNEEAEKYYLQAMEKKQPQAISNLAFLYDRIGKLEEAEKYFLQAIESGETALMTPLAITYAKQGKMDETEKWFLKAAEIGDTDAMNNLGLLYQNNGKLEEAEKYYLMAIEKNCEGAKENLLTFYNSTRQTEKEKDIYLQMAWKDDINAMNHLGMIFGNEGNFKESEKWFLKAAALGDKHAKSNLEILIKCLGIAIAIVLVITLLRLAFRIFLSVAIWIIPITLILFIYQKFNDRY